MSEETQTEDEPSIEEILDSIRQIISEDDDGEDESVEETEEPEEVVVEEKPAPAPEPEVAATPDVQDDVSTEAEDDGDDVFELTDLVNSEENHLSVDLQEPDEEDIPEAVEVELEEIQPEPEPEVVVKEPAPKPAQTKQEDSLLTDTAESAAIAAMSELVRKTAVEHAGVTLEDIVRAELKPLLRDWLDKHLPTVIERLVQEELERVSKRVLEE
tara:strand:+ start:182 stop:823 length:642 start_codon:yes stop_codon:yes gene_type:complete